MRRVRPRLHGRGVPTRVYVPYGPAWYPNFNRRMAERTANLLFILRSVLREGR